MFKTPIKLVLTASLLLAGVVLNAPSAAAVAPSNDNFSAPEDLAVSGTIVRSNVGATVTATEPESNCCSPQSTIWFRWVAPATTRVTFDTWGSDLDTVLAAYVGVAASALTEVGSDDDGMGTDATSFVQFDAVAGTTYRIQLGSWDRFDTSPNLVLSWNYARKARAANDDLANAAAFPLNATPQNVTGTTEGSTAEENNFIGELAGEQTVWYAATPSQAGILSLQFSQSSALNVYGEAGNNVLEVYTGPQGQDLITTLDPGENAIVHVGVPGPVRLRVFTPSPSETGSFTINAQYQTGLAVTTNYNPSEYNFTVGMAVRIGVTDIAQFQHDAVGAWAFIYGLAGVAPTPIAAPGPGTIAVTSVFLPAEIGQLSFLGNGWANNQPNTQKIASLALGFVLTLA